MLNILSATRLSGGVFLDAEFTAPWCVTAQVGPEDCSPFVPEPLNIIAYHYVSSGELQLQVGGETPVTVGGGEIILLPRNSPHRLGSDVTLPGISAEQLIVPAADGCLARIVHGGGGERTHILCGFLGSDTPNDPILRILPNVLVVDVAEGAAATWIESSLKFAARELVGGLPKSPAVLAKLAELLFIEAVRQYLASLPAEQSGWRAGLCDPVVGRALGLLHSRMNYRWTTEALAREVAMSRSAFAERFTRIMGEPPMRYLAQQRLQAAAQHLKRSGDSIARVAFTVGYESEAAFNRAFKREFGMPPMSWRKHAAKQDERSV